VFLALTPPWWKCPAEAEAYWVACLAVGDHPNFFHIPQGGWMGATLQRSLGYRSWS